MLRTPSYENSMKASGQYSLIHDSDSSGGMPARSCDYYDSVHAGLLRESEYEEMEPPDAKFRQSVLKNVAGYIIVTEFCERLAYFGFAGSLVLFFQTKMNMSNADADIQYSAWSGACYIMPLVGGYISETYWGRYKTILIFCLVYLAGLVLIVIGSVPDNAEAYIVYPAIYTIAVGTGGIKPNVSTFGADQFNDRYQQDRIEKESFFNWFYWGINIGTAFSFTVISYICQYGIPGLGGASWGFFWGYLLVTISMTLGILVYLSGTPKYDCEKGQPQGSVVGTTMKIYWNAMWPNKEVVSDREGAHSLDKASLEYGGNYTANQVQCVKLVTRLFPFLFVLIGYWGLYSQMSTAFQNQGCQMDLNLGGVVMIPVSGLALFNTIAILALLPVFDQYIYPYFKSRRKGGLSMLDKIGLGFWCMILAMTVAGLVEMARRDDKATPGGYLDETARDNISPCQNVDDYNPFQYQQWEAGEDVDEPANCHQISGCSQYYTATPGILQMNYLNLSCIECDDIPQMSHLSVLWQIPQYVLIGVSEILSSITALEFFYSQAPMCMRSVSQALNLSTQAIGTWLTIPLILIVNSGGIFGKKWIEENIDDGQLEKYFFLLAIIMVANQFLFYYISSGYQYKTQQELAIGFEDKDRTISM